MRNTLLLVFSAAAALAGCSADPTRTGSTAAPGLLVASAAPAGGRENAAHASGRIDLDPIVRLPGFACARTGDTAFHCTRE